jgi:hypothetical protein
MKTNKLARLMAIAALAIAACGCQSFRNLYQNDRCFLSEERYSVARELFVETGSLDIVRQRLIALEWMKAEQNEALYRLGKEFQVSPEELP